MNALRRPVECTRCHAKIASARARRFFRGALICPPCGDELRRSTSKLPVPKAPPLVESEAKPLRRPSPRTLRRFGTPEQARLRREERERRIAGSYPSARSLAWAAHLRAKHARRAERKAS